MFPLFSSTHHYRLQHLAHHQFVNDPLRDPDVSQMQTSGHRLPFPMEKSGTAAGLAEATVAAVTWSASSRVRAAYNATGTDKSPYMSKGGSRRSWRCASPSPTAGAGRPADGPGLERADLLAGRACRPPCSAVAGRLRRAAGVEVPAEPGSLGHRAPLDVVLRVGFITLVFNAIAWLTLADGAVGGALLLPALAGAAVHVVLVLHDPAADWCSTATATAAG